MGASGLGGMFVTKFDGLNSRENDRRLPENTSTQINHVDEYILNIVWGFDLHDCLLFFSSSNFSLCIWRGQVYHGQCMDQPGLACLLRGRMSVSAKKGLQVFSRLTEEALDEHATLPSHNSVLARIRTCPTLIPPPRFDTSTNQSQSSSCHLLTVGLIQSFH